jgi:hypothetical protein
MNVLINYLYVLHTAKNISKRIVSSLAKLIYIQIYHLCKSTADNRKYTQLFFHNFCLLQLLILIKIFYDFTNSVNNTQLKSFKLQEGLQLYI